MTSSSGATISLVKSWKKYKQKSSAKIILVISKDMLITALWFKMYVNDSILFKRCHMADFCLRKCLSLPMSKITTSQTATSTLPLILALTNHNKDQSSMGLYVPWLWLMWSWFILYWTAGDKQHSDWSGTGFIRPSCARPGPHPSMLNQ